MKAFCTTWWVFFPAGESHVESGIFQKKIKVGPFFTIFDAWVFRSQIWVLLFLGSGIWTVIGLLSVSLRSTSSILGTPQRMRGGKISVQMLATRLRVVAPLLHCCLSWLDHPSRASLAHWNPSPRPRCFRIERTQGGLTGRVYIPAAGRFFLRGPGRRRDHSKNQKEIQKEFIFSISHTLRPLD